jgi:hypothetical protein
MSTRLKAACLAVAGWVALSGYIGFAVQEGGNALKKAPLLTPNIAQTDWVVGSEGPPEATKAAAELAKYMSKVLGVQVAAAPWPASVAKHVFVIADAKHGPPALAQRLEGKRLDAFLIQYPVEIDGRQVCLLLANDEKACDLPLYYFLTKYMGVNWVGPDPLGEVLMPQPAWKMPDRIDDLENPDYEQRLWNEPHGQPHRWLAGIVRMQFRPNLHAVFNPTTYGDQPDLYPFYGGKRNMPAPHGPTSGWQPCTANPRAVDIAVQYGLDFLEKNPDKVSFSLCANDGDTGDCMCELCRARDSKVAFDFGQPFLTDRYTRFDNAVIERVLQKNPRAYVAIVGYNRCKEPPVEVKIHPRTLVFDICSNTSAQPDFVERQKDWKAAGAIPCIYEWLWDSGFLTVRNYPHAIADAVRLTHDMGGFGYYGEGDRTIWAAGGPKMYVLAHVLWDTKANPDALLDQYMQLAFGEPAAPAMRAYFDRWEAIWERGGKAIRYNTGRDWRDASQLEQLTCDDLRAMDEALAKAKVAPATEGEKKRIGYVDTYYQWLRIDADQYLIARELADEAFVSRSTPEQVMTEAERGMDLTEQFNEIWKKTISQDRTDWLLPARSHKNPDTFWKEDIEPIRKGVLAMYEPSLDRAFGTLTRNLLKTHTKEQVVAFWIEQSGRHPKLIKWARTQLQLLEKGPGPNVVLNGHFEDGQPGNPPTIANWTLSGSWEDIPTDFAWEANSGRNGRHALAIGRGYRGTAEGSACTQPGHRYRLSVWYKTNTPRAHISGGVTGASLNFDPVVGEWRQTETTFTASGDATRVKLSISGGGLDKGQWVWFDDVVVAEIYGE